MLFSAKEDGLVERLSDAVIIDVGDVVCDSLILTSSGNGEGESRFSVYLEDGAVDKSESTDLELSMLVRGFGLVLVAAAEAERCVNR